MTAVDVWLTGPLETAAMRATELASIGVDGVFTFENAHDVFLPLAFAAPSGLDLMTNVAIAFPRSPMHLAHAAWDLHALSGGRFRLGLGTQVRAHIERRYGTAWSEPVERMRDTVLATKAILTSWQERDRIDHHGRFWSHTLMTPAFDPGPNPHGMPPVLVGALGPRMTQMAAEVADGLLVMPFNSARHFRERTVPAIERGLAASGRLALAPGSDFEVVAEVIVATGADLEAARRGVRGLLSFYGSTPAYKPVLDVEGWGDLQPELNTLSKQGRWADMATLVTDEMVDTIAVSGSPAECAAQIAARYPEASRVCCYFPGYDISDDVIGELAAAIRTAAAPAAAPPS